MEHTGHQYTDKAPFNVPSIGRTVMHFDGNDDQQFTLGEVFLNPTRIYCDPIIDMLQYAETDGAQFQRSDVRAICHITGGGLSNLLRLHESLGWHIDSPLPPHPEFDWLQSVGGIETREMYRTFNMGTGMVLAVSSDKAEQITAWLEERMLGTKIIGHVHDQGHKVTHALEGVEFSHY